MIEEKIAKLLELKIEKYFFITFQYYSPVIAEIQLKYKDFTLIKVPKRGQDIGGFFVALMNIFNRIDNIQEDDIVFKLHTKGKLNEFVILLNPLCDDIDKILSLFLINREAGMIGSKDKVILLDSYNTDKIQELCRELKISYQRNDKFIGGAIFAMRLIIIYKAFDKNVKVIDSFYRRLENEYYITNDHSTYIHSWERMYGIIVRNQGYKVLGI
jgi:hypothetical protein